MKGLSLRQFAKQAGISTVTVSDLIERGVIERDVNGLISYNQLDKVWQNKVIEKIKTCTLYVGFNREDIDYVRKNLIPDNGFEISSREDIYRCYQDISEKKIGDYEKSNKVNEKYKREILTEFHKRYLASKRLFISDMVADERINKLPACDLNALAEYGTDISKETIQSVYGDGCQKVQSVLDDINERIQEKFDKLIDSLDIYWENDETPVFTRKDLGLDTFNEDEIIKSRQRFKMTTQDALKIGGEGYKNIVSSFQNASVYDFNKLSLYSTVVVDENYTEDNFRAVKQWISNHFVNKIIFLTSKEEFNTKIYIPRWFLYDIVDFQVIYHKSIKFMPVNFDDAVSVKSSESETVSVGDSVSKTDSGVDSSKKEAVEPVPEPPETEIIRQSDIEIVSNDEINAKETIEKLLNSVG